MNWRIRYNKVLLLPHRFNPKEKPNPSNESQLSVAPPPVQRFVDEELSDSDEPTTEPPNSNEVQDVPNGNKGKAKEPSLQRREDDQLGSLEGSPAIGPVVQREEAPAVAIPESADALKTADISNKFEPDEQMAAYLEAKYQKNRSRYHLVPVKMGTLAGGQD